jgi:hypothetical protein
MKLVSIEIGNIKYYQMREKSTEIPKVVKGTVGRFYGEEFER